MILANIWNKIKGVFKGMTSGKSVETVLHITPAISNEMANAIQLWEDMYQDKSPWLRNPVIGGDPTTVKSLGLASFIASEKARMAVLEMESEITPMMEEVEEPNPDYTEPVIDELGNITGGGVPKTIKKEVPTTDTARADYLNEQYKKLKDVIRRQLEYGIAKGGLVIMPYVATVEDAVDGETGYEIEFDFIQADNFYPVSFDGSGKVTDAVFLRKKVEKEYTYTLVMHHTLNGSVMTVENRAFKSSRNTNLSQSNLSDTDFGQEISLKEVPEWAGLSEKTSIRNVEKLLFAYFKMPEANTIDPYSPLGVSGFSRAVDLIQEADKQYSRLLWEFEGGELAIDVDRDALSERVMNKDGSIKYYTTRPVLQERLFRKIDLNNEETYNVFSPALRDASLINGLNSILMRIEDVCALSRGTIADVSAEARTATELKILKQRSYSANAEIQKVLEKTLRDVAYIMDVYCTLYNIVGDAGNGIPGSSTIGQWDISFEWDDSIIVDIDTEIGKRMTLLQNGITSKVEIRMWYFGETEEQAREALAKIDEENRISMEQEMQYGGFGKGLNNA